MSSDISFEQFTVLVTGAGGAIGQGILQCLRRMESCPRVIATDLSPTATGLFWADHSFVLPHCSQEESYIRTLRHLCQRYDVSVIFPGSDKEARLLALSNAWMVERNILLAASPQRVWEVTGDKLKTHQLASQIGVPSPVTLPYSPEAVANLANAQGLPVVLKPLRSSGSRGICYINDTRNLPGGISPDEYIVQAYLDPTSSEFTVGAYFNRHSQASSPVAMVAMRRKLGHGNTISAEIVSPEIFELPVSTLAQHLQLAGYCNFQFIQHERALYLLEINARYSSSISISLQAGCNFVQYFLLDHLKNLSGERFRSSPGKMILRYLADYVIDVQRLQAIDDLSNFSG